MTTLALGGCSDLTAPTSPSRLDNSAVNTSTGSVRSDTSSSTIASTAPSSPSTANYEIKFITGMVDHHQMAVEMAEICLANAVHAELRQMCEQIVAAQSREIEQLQSWLQDWYSISYAPQMTSRGGRELARLNEASGGEFEIMFMEMMIQHHQAAISSAQTCLERASHRQLIRLCENIIRAQSAEIQQLQEWLCQWYGRCATSS